MSETARRIDINADVGEGHDDARLFPFLSSVNVACGGHAGDDATMRHTCTLARASGLAIGAHPGFPDRDGFGRRAVAADPGEVEALVSSQVRRLASIAAAVGARLVHVKPHGALYNLAAADASMAAAVAMVEAEAPPGRFPPNPVVSVKAYKDPPPVAPLPPMGHSASTSRR